MIKKILILQMLSTVSYPIVSYSTCSEETARLLIADNYEKGKFAPGLVKLKGAKFSYTNSNKSDQWQKIVMPENESIFIKRDYFGTDIPIRLKKTKYGQEYIWVSKSGAAFIPKSDNEVLEVIVHKINSETGEVLELLVQGMVEGKIQNHIYISF